MLWLAAWLTYDIAAASRFPLPLRSPTTVKLQVHCGLLQTPCTTLSSRQRTRSCKGPTRTRYVDTVLNDMVHFLTVVAFVGAIGLSAGG